MNGIQIVTELAVWLSENTEIPVFKYEKPADLKGEYIVVNSMPFTFGGGLNEGTLNLNIHVPDTHTGVANTRRLAEMYTEVASLIPEENDSEETHGLFLNGFYYTILSDSNVMADTDGTHFINLKIKAIYNDLIL